MPQGYTSLVYLCCVYIHIYIYLGMEKVFYIQIKDVGGGGKRSELLIFLPCSLCNHACSGQVNVKYHKQGLERV